MSNSSDARRQINNELKIRSHNQKLKRVLEQTTPVDVKGNLRIDFYCECSNEHCNTRVPMTLTEYDKLHSNPARFVIAKGHESPKVERVAKVQAQKTIVEKYAL